VRVRVEGVRHHRRLGFLSRRGVVGRGREGGAALTLEWKAFIGQLRLHRDAHPLTRKLFCSLPFFLSSRNQSGHSGVHWEFIGAVITK
jgi:hypothetical protein